MGWYGVQARAMSAKTSKQVADMVSSVSTGTTALKAFERMEEKVCTLFAIVPEHQCDTADLP